jgi:hypothetical protein
MWSLAAGWNPCYTLPHLFLFKMQRFGIEPGYIMSTIKKSILLDPLDAPNL